MPTYGYRCTECGVEFERFQKISDPALTECETCGGAVKKLLYPVGIQFKGSGFYVNDYAKKAAGGSAKGAADKSAADGSGASTSDASATSGAAAAAPAPAPADSSKPAPAPAGGGTASSS